MCRSSWSYGFGGLQQVLGLVVVGVSSMGLVLLQKNKSAFVSC